MNTDKLKWGYGASNICASLMKKLYAKSSIPVVKLFNPCGIGTWYLSEAEIQCDDDGNFEDIIFFGLCDLGFPELGYVSYKELSSQKLRFGLTIERDLHWKSGSTFDQLKERSE